MLNRYYAVTGNPILHSKSPVIFNNIFSRINSGQYYFRLACDSANEAIMMFKKLQLTGMNVTAPYKADVMPFMNIIDESAQIIGGVNTVVYRDNQFKGYNTDFHGVTKSLEDNGVQLDQTNAIVLGAGGAGRAASYGLVKKGANLIIINRTVEKAKKTADLLDCQYGGLEQLEKSLKTHNLLVSSLSPEADIVKQEWLTKDHIIFDANYKASKLTESALSLGCKVVRGEDWLINQALPAYEFFTLQTIKPNIIKDIFNTQYQPNKTSNIVLVSPDESYSNKIGIELAQKLQWEKLNIIDQRKLDSLKQNIYITNNLSEINNIHKHFIIIYLLTDEHQNSEAKHLKSDIIINGVGKTEKEIVNKIYNEYSKTYQL